MINISEKISSLRKAHNLTQEALGEAVGVSAQAVSKWEKGDSLPDISVIPDICRTFGISADTLIGSEGNMTSEMYVEKALELCNNNMDEKMRLLHKIMRDSGGENNKTEPAHLTSALWDAHVLAIADGRGFGMFFSDMEYIKNMMTVDFSSSKLLKFISDEKLLKIFTLICINGRLTESEIIKMTGFSEQEVTERLFMLMKCSVIKSVMDAESNIKEMAYAIEIHGILLLGIMTNAFLFDPESRKGLKVFCSHMNTNPDKLRKFMD